MLSYTFYILTTVKSTVIKRHYWLIFSIKRSITDGQTTTALLGHFSSKDEPIRSITNNRLYRFKLVAQDYCAKPETSDIFFFVISNRNIKGKDARAKEKREQMKRPKGLMEQKNSCTPNKLGYAKLNSSHNSSLQNLYKNDSPPPSLVINPIDLGCTNNWISSIFY